MSSPAHVLNCLGRDSQHTNRFIRPAYPTPQSCHVLVLTVITVAQEAFVLTIHSHLADSLPRPLTLRNTPSRYGNATRKSNISLPVRGSLLHESGADAAALTDLPLVPLSRLEAQRRRLGTSSQARKFKLKSPPLSPSVTPEGATPHKQLFELGESPNPSDLNAY